MQTVLLLLTLLVASKPHVVSTIVLADFQQEALVQHNYYRQLHCVGLLQLNSTLNSIAQSYAEYLAANDLFAHSGRAGLGENLWAMYSSAVISYVNGSTPTSSWYTEISLYNFAVPGFSSVTGHFTQIVWKTSTQVGIGIAFSSDGKAAYVVANYYVAGNLIGAFASNVPPLCSTTTGISTTTTSTTSQTTTTGTSTTKTSTTSRATTTTKRTTTTRRRRGREAVDN